MLSFAAEFPLEHSHDSTNFLRTVQKWILGSPHTVFTQNTLGDLVTLSDVHIQRGVEVVDALRVTANDEESAGVKYTRREGDREWVTTVVFSRSRTASWVGLRVSCESSHPSVRLPPAKKPVLVRILLEDLGGTDDGSLNVGKSPLRLQDTDIDLAARLIKGTAGCHLPIVYVSAGFQGDYVLDHDRLARDLAGMAHVVVEPNRPFSLRLKIEVDSENVYGGAVGVYWPNGAGRRSFFPRRESESPEELSQAIIDEIRVALMNRRPFDRCTWAYVQESASRRTIQSLRASGSQEVEKYIETFDKEIAAKSSRLEEAEAEIARLRGELQIFQKRLPPSATSILRAGAEQDLYPNEVYGIVRDAVNDAKLRATNDSRRAHVLTAMLEANPPGDDVAKAMREKLKGLLRGSRGVDAKIQRGLEEMGFSIRLDGKHYKIVFQGDDRYTFTLPASGSDHRGGLNAAGDIARLLF